MSRFGNNEIVMLLGAGASVDAGMPDAGRMIALIEDLIADDWRCYRDLYHYVKSSIIFSEGIHGRFAGYSYNIERLVSTLDELIQRDQHPVYPFVGAWNAKLIDLAGVDFCNVRKFRRAIHEQLCKKWLNLNRAESAAYYNGLAKLKDEWNYPLRVFTLNYDLCVEASCISLLKVERGFRADRTWGYEQYENEEKDPKDLYLYKLHGSMDWVYEDGQLICLDNISGKKPENVAIIFGTPHKMQYLDPFLYYIYQFRRWTLEEARLIIAVGYGFGDDHINGILRQSLQTDDLRRLLVVRPFGDVEITAIREDVASRLGLEGRTRECVECWNMTARAFFESGLSLAALEQLFPLEDDLFDEI